MKIFIPLLYVVAISLAEPPVSDGYAAALASHDHHHDDHREYHASDYQRSLSQDYGPPSFTSSRNVLSSEYGVPTARPALNSRGQSQNNGYPAVRVSFNQRFRPAALRNSQEITAATKTQDKDHGVPNASGGVSQEYGIPSARSLSQEYGEPSIVSARTLSTEYGLPAARYIPSQEYGVPVVAARSNQKSDSQTPSFRSSQPENPLTQGYSTPSARSQFPTSSISSGYTIPLVRSNDISLGYNAPIHSASSSSGSQSLSRTHSAPKSGASSTYSSPASRSLYTSYGIPSAMDSDAYSQDFNSVSSTYGVPSHRDLSDADEAPSARGLSQDIEVPSNHPNLKNSATASLYPASRSFPSLTYLPASRTALPSEQYGVPEQRSSQGYDDARASALDELLNQEPASYDFAYQIEDVESGSDFGHTETREENHAKGSYFVVLPDGTKQTVEYEADERGYKPRISVEPVAAGVGAGGYDENAAEIRSAEDGPY